MDQSPHTSSVAHRTRGQLLALSASDSQSSSSSSSHSSTVSQPGAVAASVPVAAPHSASSSSSSIPPLIMSAPAAASAVDMQALLNHLIQAQQQLAAIQGQQLAQSKISAEQTLARAAAGQPPLFAGKSNDMEADSWSIAMESWFETAKLTEESEKILIAASAMRDTAQVWWQTMKDSGAAAAITTWASFKAVVGKKFLPQDLDRHLLGKLKALIRGNNTDVCLYTNRFYAISQRLDRKEIDCLMDYETGLPDYRTASARKRYTTLKDASEAAVASYNAAKAAGVHHRGGAGLNNMDSNEWSGPAADDHSQSSSSSAAPYSAEGNAASMNNMNVNAYEPQRVSSLQEQVAQLTAMMVQMRNNSGGNNYRRGSSNNNYRGRVNGRDFNRQGRNYSRSPVRRSPWKGIGVTEEQWHSRGKNGQCYKCGSADHRIGECALNKQKPTN